MTYSIGEKPYAPKIDNDSEYFDNSTPLNEFRTLTPGDMPDNSKQNTDMNFNPTSYLIPLDRKKPHGDNDQAPSS